MHFINRLNIANEKDWPLKTNVNRSLILIGFLECMYADKRYRTPAILKNGQKQR